MIVSFKCYTSSKPQEEQGKGGKPRGLGVIFSFLLCWVVLPHNIKFLLCLKEWMQAFEPSRYNKMCLLFFALYCLSSIEICKNIFCFSFDLFSFWFDWFCFNQFHWCLISLGSISIRFVVFFNTVQIISITISLNIKSYL